ncbi:MAG: helix-turn-helix transcriptional regulator [Myxococcaceae bacterium]|nr:helix-turn-helix transcriptional regulator [Myxococcaceae bacterium]
MRRVSLAHHPCPIARSADQIGDGSSLLLMRDTTLGFRRFAELQARLGIAPNMLTRRLETLTRHGLLERRRDASKPDRYEYVPTEKGLELVPVLLALGAWGNRWLAPRGAPLLNVHPKTRRRIDPIVIDRHSRRELKAGGVGVVAGPGAPAAVRRQLKQPLVFGGPP